MLYEAYKLIKKKKPCEIDGKEAPSIFYIENVSFALA